MTSHKADHSTGQTARSKRSSPFFYGSLEVPCNLKETYSVSTRNNASCFWNQHISTPVCTKILHWIHWSKALKKGLKNSRVAQPWQNPRWGYLCILKGSDSHKRIIQIQVDGDFWAGGCVCVWRSDLSLRTQTWFLSSDRVKTLEDEESSGAQSSRREIYTGGSRLIGNRHTE